MSDTSVCVCKHKAYEHTGRWVSDGKKAGFEKTACGKCDCKGLKVKK